MRVLLLTCNTGQGHNAAALAVRQALEKKGAACRQADALSFLGEKASELIAGAFVNIAVKTPRAFGFMYNAGEKISADLADRIKSPVYAANMLYAQNLNRYLIENRIDAAVCPHLFPAEALTYLKRRHALATRCYFVSTDYTCIPFLDETDMDAVFLPSPDLREEFLVRGIPAEKLQLSGIPVLEKFKAPLEAGQAKALLRGGVACGEEPRAVDLPDGAPSFLVMTGGEGCGNAAAITESLLDRLGPGDGRIVILTGRNRQLHHELTCRFGGDKRVLPLAFTDRVELFMSGCDVLLTKPGGISSTEAAVRGTALIHTAPIPGVETVNARFFSTRFMSILAEDAGAAADSALRLAQDAPQRRRMLEAQSQYVCPNAAQVIADRILEDCAGREEQIQ